MVQDDIASIEAAISTLLTAMTSERDNRPTGSGNLRATPFVKGAIPTREDCFRSALVRDPVYSALRQGVARLGQHLYERLGDTDLLRLAGERIADAVPARSGLRLGMIDHAWDGVGKDGDRWWA